MSQKIPALAPTAVLSLNKAKVGFGALTLFQSLDITIERGQWVTLLGPNGVGKSALLKSMLGILPLQAGTRVCDAVRLGYVPQRFVAPSESLLTVGEFLGLHRKKGGRHERDRDEAARQMALVESLDLRRLFRRPLKVLSGGEVQRVLLAFALWNDPDLLFLDEYSEAIDFSGKSVVAAVLSDLRRHGKHTVVEVSHDLTSVLHLSDRVLLLRGGILYDGSPREQGFHQCLHRVYGERIWIAGGPDERS